MDIQHELLAEFDRETAATRKILEAIPDNADYGWKPSEKSMPLGALAGHIADMPGQWAVSALTLDKLEFGPDNKWEPFRPTTRAQVLERFDKGLVATRTALERVTPEKWDQKWQFVWNGQVVVEEPRYGVLRSMVLNHLVHHRAQLGVYIRLLGGKLPGVYGPSADEGQ
ncbi:MAG: DinB family protein [Acidobacteriaceae bacterium]|nr:DinB family protein [Acidobacteriaceae bacterium]